MSEPVTAPLTAADHAAKGQDFLAQAEMATLAGHAAQAAGLALLARTHFLAARTLDARAAMELNREIRRDMKATTAGMFDQLGRLGGGGEPGLLAQAASVG